MTAPRHRIPVASSDTDWRVFMRGPSDYDLEEMTAEAKIAPGAFRILASSQLAPYCTVAASGKVEQRWSSKVREALLALTPETTVEIGGERLKVLDRALLTGFEALDDSAYDTIRAWAKTARMPPYDDE